MRCRRLFTRTSLALVAVIGSGSLHVAPSIAWAQGDRGSGLRPRFATVSEIRKQRKRPRFVTPSGKTATQITSEAAANANAGTPQEDDAATSTAAVTHTLPHVSGAPRHEVPYYPPSFYSYLTGPRQSWSGEQFLTRPRDVPRAPQTMEEARESGKRALFYARGFYSVVSKSLRDWSGVQIASQIEIKDGASLALVFHHELREESGQLGLVATSLRVAPNVHILSSLGFGGGADFLPITKLDTEVRGVVPHFSFMHFGIGGGASWWRARRNHTYGTISLSYWLPYDLSGENRLEVTRVASDTTAARLNVRATTTMLKGKHGKQLSQVRVSVGDQPQYVPGATLESQPDKVTVDGSFGFRHWIDKSYGYVVSVEIGWQKDTYHRLGFDFSLFLQI